MPEFVPIREILRRNDMLLHVEGAQPGYAYAYEKFGGVAGNQHVMRAKMAGFETVTAEDPENPGVRDSNGCCVVGDVVLMRIPQERLGHIHQEIGKEVSDKRGRSVRQDQLNQVNEELSKVLGRRVNVTFAFEDQTELNNRRGV